jgi:hypothetical protein
MGLWRDLRLTARRPVGGAKGCTQRRTPPSGAQVYRERSLPFVLKPSHHHRASRSSVPFCSSLCSSSFRLDPCLALPCLARSQQSFLQLTQNLFFSSVSLEDPPHTSQHEVLGISRWCCPGGSCQCTHHHLEPL